MSRIFTLILSGLLLTGAICSSDAAVPARIDTIRTSILIPRPFKEPVKSMCLSESDPIDTLDTVNEYVKVILYGDNTWQYYKTPDFQKLSGVFDESWNNRDTNPYRLDKEQLPYSWSIWLVDSLSQYRCPYQSSIHYRGKFGIRRGRRHQGVDIPLKTGSPIHAAFTGKVRISKYMGGYGNVVVLRHENGLETFYGHLSQRNVEEGQWVNAGDVIGLGGSTGRSTGPHLHFETRYKGFAFDPQWLIDFETGELRHRLFILKKKYFSPYSCYEQDFEDEFKNEEEDKKEDAEKAAMRWHTIKSGDTLGRIAINNGTTVSAICKLNGITPNTVLKINRKIRVR